MNQPWKKRIRITLLVLLALIIACGVWGFLIEPNRLLVRQETIAIGNWPKELSGMRIAVIADIHAGSPFINEAKLQKLVVETNQAKPDLIVLLGDFMIKDRLVKQPIAPERTAEILKNFSAPLGVFGVMGNHDWWSQADVRESFEQKGIRVLKTTSAKSNGATVHSGWLAWLICGRSLSMWTRRLPKRHQVLR